MNVRFFVSCWLLMIVTFSLSGQYSFKKSRNVVLQQDATFVDSFQIQPAEWDGSVVSFAFTVDKYDDFTILSAELVTQGKTVSMMPGCETNLENFSFVSKLEFLSGQQSDWLKIVLKPENTDRRDIVVHYHVSGVQPLEPVVKKENSISERSCVCPHPEYIPRAVWGQSYNLTDQIYRPPAAYTDVSHLIIHHSATSNQSNNWPAVVASIFNYHANTNQWQDIGYNWLIDPEGNLYQGRGGGEDVRGAHMCGYNNNTMGVCLLGTFTNADPDSRALRTLDALLAYKSCQKNLDPLGSDSIVSHTGFMKHVSGHRDGCAPNYTECPGNKLHAFLPVLRENCVTFIQDSCENFSGLEPDLNGHSPEIIILSDETIQIKNLSGRSAYIADVSGKIIHEFIMATNDEWFRFDSVVPGFYFIVVVNEKAVLTKKWIKL